MCLKRSSKIPHELPRAPNSIRRRPIQYPSKPFKRFQKYGQMCTDYVAADGYRILPYIDGRRHKLTLQLTEEETGGIRVVTRFPSDVLADRFAIFLHRLSNQTGQHRPSWPPQKHDFKVNFWSRPCHVGNSVFPKVVVSRTRNDTLTQKV